MRGQTHPWPLSVGRVPWCSRQRLMADDQTFRLILALGMAAVLPVGIYHRVRSQASREKLDRRQEGLFILLTLPPLNPRDMAMTIPGDFVLASVGDLMMRRPASQLADDAVQAAHLPAVRKTAREVAGGVPSGGGAEPLNQLAVDIACLLINEDLPRSHQCYL